MRDASVRLYKPPKPTLADPYAQIRWMFFQAEAEYKDTTSGPRIRWAANRYLQYVTETNAFYPELESDKRFYLSQYWEADALLRFIKWLATQELKSKTRYGMYKTVRQVMNMAYALRIIDAVVYQASVFSGVSETKQRSAYTAREQDVINASLARWIGLANSVLNGYTPTGQGVPYRPKRFEFAPLVIKGKEYTVSEAAKHFGIRYERLSERLRTGWPTPQAVGLEPRPAYRADIEFTVEGVTYPSVKAAARAYGLSPATVGPRVRKGLSPDQCMGLAPVYVSQKDERALLWMFENQFGCDALAMYEQCRRGKAHRGGSGFACTLKRLSTLFIRWSVWPHVDDRIVMPLAAELSMLTGLNVESLKDLEIDSYQPKHRLTGQPALIYRKRRAASSNRPEERELHIPLLDVEELYLDESVVERVQKVLGLTLAITARIRDDAPPEIARRLFIFEDVDRSWREGSRAIVPIDPRGKSAVWYNRFCGDEGLRQLFGGDFNFNLARCRPTLATNMVLAGATLFEVQVVLGHASIQTTAAYLDGQGLRPAFNRTVSEALERIPEVSDIIAGRAAFRDDLPVWHGFFGHDIWPFVEPESPLYNGQVSSSLVWNDYIDGRGATHHHPNSAYRSTYELCLTPDIVHDLKIAAVICGYFPTLVKHSHAKSGQLAPITVKARIDDLAKLFSLVIVTARRNLNLYIWQLSQISFELLKEVIPTYPGPSTQLKRALKLISDPTVQSNLSAPLQWGQVDLDNPSIAWREKPQPRGIPPLLDSQFLFLLKYCKESITHFKTAAGLTIHDAECRALERSSQWFNDKSASTALDAYYGFKGSSTDFRNAFGHSLAEIHKINGEGHISALVLILLLTGIRRTETVFLKRDCLVSLHGYWFLRSKVVKHRPKDTPISEGWLVIDLTRDAYDILMFITQKTGNPNLFSSPFRGYESEHGYRGATLNKKISQWLEKIDIHGLFSGWKFSVHQCRETLVAQLANQEVGLPFISMQLKHFHSQFNSMPNAVTAGYGQYRKQLMTRITNRLAVAREEALTDVYGEDARFAGGGGAAHKERIDAFFSGLGLFGEEREQYIQDMARRGVKLMPTSIGHCAKNFLIATDDAPPPCYGDYHCDPNCHSHVITARSVNVLRLRRDHALTEATLETDKRYKIIWLGLAETLDKHITVLNQESPP